MPARLILAIGISLITLLYAMMIVAGLAHGAEIPKAAAQYRHDLVRSARFVWGVDAPVATMAAQIHQESAFRPAVCSKFACGLTQFTPATAAWISGAYTAELGTADVMNPLWAMKALARYDRHLYARIGGTASLCDRWAMTLSAYNGGAGWVTRDRALAKARGADPARWWGHVELHSARAAWALLMRWQPLYAGWGPLVACGRVP
jgi:soluble lytic murein transglycosylase-like protein